MMALFLLGLMVASQQPEDGTITATIEARPSIIPALASYVACLNRNQAQLSQRAGPLRAEGMRRVVERARTRCARSRAAARERALRLISSDTGVPVGQRQAVVDSGFASVDASDEAFLQALARREAAERGPRQ